MSSIGTMRGLRIALGFTAMLLFGAVLQPVGVSAVMSGRTRNPSATLATMAVYAPTNATAGASAANVVLSWQAGSRTSGTTIAAGNNGTSNNCSSTSLTTLASVTTATYTDARATPAGTYECYQLTGSAGSWTSIQNNPRIAAQLGFVASTVSISPGNTAGRVSGGEIITVSFNQAVAASSGPTATNTICTTSTAMVLAATTTSGSCNNNETNTLGVLSGGTFSQNQRWNATYSWSADAKTLTITVTSRVSGSSSNNTSGSWTFTPTTAASKVLSAVGSLKVCTSNAGGANCTPTATGGF